MVILSSCETEYIVAFMVAYQVAWLEILLEELNLIEDKPMRLLVDNKSTIDLAKRSIAHGRSKHIETRLHFSCDQVTKEKLELEYCKSKEQVADILTKPLKLVKFHKLRDKLGILSLADLN